MASLTAACLPSRLLQKFDEILKNPEDFITPRSDLSGDLKIITKRLYDAVKKSERKCEKTKTKGSAFQSDALSELVIEGFDDEQIWQELELQNEAVIGGAMKSVSRLLTANDHEISTLNGDTSPVEDDSDAHAANSEADGNDSPDDDAEDSDSPDAKVDDADDDAMSDISIEMEKALDKQIAFDRRRGIPSESDSSDHSERENNESENEEESEGEAGSEASEEVIDEDDDEDADSDGGKDDGLNLLDLADKCEDAPDGQSSTDKRKLQRQSEVEDQFFRLDELEDFLQAEDRKEMRLIDGKGAESEEDEADLELFTDVVDEYAEGDSDNEDIEGSKKSARFMRYKDFFDPPKALHKRPTEEDSGGDVTKEVTLDEQWYNRNNRDSTNSAVKRKHQLLDDYIAEGGDDAEPGKRIADKSSFEKRQEKLEQRIQQLEENNLSTKPWQMSGETSSAVRPENSLLQEHLQFDHMTKQAPIITEETTTKLEDIIRQRIKDQIWDDVERKVKPVDDPIDYKKKIVLDQEKSKIGLAEVYEQEYVKQQKTESEKEVNEPKEHKEIRKNMASLFAKLDALSNFHFVPKPVRPELKIVSNLPAITVEEVAPVSVSDAMLLAPEEIKEKPKGVELGKSERTATDKKRERREKKAKQCARQKHRESKEKLVAKLNPGLGNKYSKLAAMKKLADEDNVTVINPDGKSRSSLASSKNFFSQLQEEIKTSIGARKSVKVTKDKKGKLSVASFKL